MDNLSDNTSNTKKKRSMVGSAGDAVALSSQFKKQEKKSKKEATVSQKDQQFQSFFRYLRINEIQVQITYIHSKKSTLNVHNMNLRLQPFIIHGKFQTMQQVLNEYEKHCKRRVLSQTPNLINHLIFKVKEQVKEVKLSQDEQRS